LWLISAVASGPALAADTETYTNPFYLYAVDFPGTWHVKQVGKTTSIHAPLESEQDDFAENIQIVAEEPKGAGADVSLLDYHRAGVGNAQKFLSGFALLEEARTEWLGRETIVMLYEATLHGDRFKFKDYKFRVGQTVYVLTYTARAADFETYLPQAEEIMRSIRVSP
jgi:hypothetical protein